MTREHFIAIVENNVKLNASLTEMLTGKGFKVRSFYAGPAFEDAARNSQFRQHCAVIIAGFPFPGYSLDQIQRALLKLYGGATLPQIINYYSEDSKQDALRGVIMGVDYAISKDGPIERLLLPVYSLMRIFTRSVKELEECIAWSTPDGVSIKLREAKRTIMINETAIHISKGEYALLQILMERAGTVVSYADVIERVYNEPLNEGAQKRLRVLTSRTNKVFDDTLGYDLIKSKRGFGLFV